MPIKVITDFAVILALSTQTHTHTAHDIRSTLRRAYYVTRARIYD